MEDILIQLGVGGGFAVIVLEKVFAFVGKFKNGKNGEIKATSFPPEVIACLANVQRDSTELLSIHKGADNKKIGEQIQDIWYDRKAMLKATEKLYTAVDNLSLIVAKSNEHYGALNKSIVQLNKNIKNGN